MNILIRKANLSDAESIHALIEKLAPLFLHNIAFSQLGSFQLERYKEYLQSSQFCFYVAFESTTSQNLVGVIALKYPTHLYHLYVAEDYHRQGIAKKLWHHLLHFQINNHPERDIMTVNSSLNAVEMYTKFGFERQIEGYEEMNSIRYVPMKRAHFKTS